MTEQPTNPGAKPTHRLYRVEGTGKSATWTEIGAAWPNKDEQGFSLKSPLEGRIVMRKITARKPKEEEVA